MIVSKIADAIRNDVQGGLAGYNATVNMSLEQLEDEVVEERLLVIKQYAKQNLIPKKELMYSLNCIPVDCKSLDKCCEASEYDEPVAHFEVPQILTDYGEEGIEFIGSTDKKIKFKVYTNRNFKFHKYKARGANKPYVYIDTTPNENNLYDGYIFNAPLLERLTVIAIFKDPRQVAELACCDYTDADNFTFIATEVKKNLINKKLNYYRQLHPYPILLQSTQNDQTPK